MAEDLTFQLCHTIREGNIWVNFLAKLGTMSKSDLLIVLNPPYELHLLLTANSTSVFYHHGQQSLFYFCFCFNFFSCNKKKLLPSFFFLSTEKGSVMVNFNPKT